MDIRRAASPFGSPRAPSLAVLTRAICVCALLGAVGCDKKVEQPVAPKPAATDPALLEKLLVNQSVRAQAMKDWTIAGKARSASGEEVGFQLAFAQPGKLRSTLDDGKSKVMMVYDGSALIAHDITRNVAQRRDLATLPEEDKVLLVQQAFGRLFCEGWRPPLVAPSQTRAEIIDGTPTLVVTLKDDVLKEERFLFSPTTYEFAGRSTRDKSGNEVSFLRVLEEKKDPTTGLVVPVRWRKKDASGDVEMHIESFQVNAGADAASFSTNIPAGATVAP